MIGSTPLQHFRLHHELYGAVPLDDAVIVYEELKLANKIVWPYELFDVTVPFTYATNWIYKSSKFDWLRKEATDSLKNEMKHLLNTNGADELTFRCSVADGRLYLSPVAEFVAYTNNVMLFKTPWQKGTIPYGLKFLVPEEGGPSREDEIMTADSNWMNLGNSTLALLQVLLATKNIERTTTVNKLAKLGRGKQRHMYSTTLSIGKITQTVTRDGVEIKESEVALWQVRPHWRRSHMRRQHYGPRNSYVKDIVVPAVFVNVAMSNEPPARTGYNVVKHHPAVG